MCAVAVAVLLALPGRASASYECVGSPKSCSSVSYVSTACRRVAGCVWSSFNENCWGGSNSCAGMSNSLNCYNQGCTWRLAETEDEDTDASVDGDSRPATGVQGDHPVSELFNGAFISAVELPTKLTRDYATYDMFLMSNGPSPKAQLPYVLVLAWNDYNNQAAVYSLRGGNDAAFTLLVEVTAGGGSVGEEVTAMFLDDRKAVFPLGGELWVTDGTPSNTQRMARISDDSQLIEFLLFQNEAYFFAGDKELWKTDGKAAVLVERFESGGLGELAAANDLFLLLTIPSESTVLASDGVSPAEVITTDAPNAKLRNRHKVPFVNNRALFRADNGLWSTEGTADTTVNFSGLVANRYANPSESSSRAYFMIERRYVFTTDGTADGTRPLNVGGFEVSQHLSPDGTFDVADFGGRLQFLPAFHGLQSFGANDGSELTLWTTDGEESATLIKTIYGFAPTAGAPLDDGRFLLRSTNEIWITDGSPGGTMMLLRFTDDDDVIAGGESLVVFNDGSVVFDTILDSGEAFFWRVGGVAESSEPIINIDISTTVAGETQDISSITPSSSDGIENKAQAISSRIILPFVVALVVHCFM